MRLTVSTLLLSLVGGGIIAFALVIGGRARLGLEPGSTGQITLIVIGLLIVGIALFGHRLRRKKVGAIYKSVAVILLNTLLIFVLVEVLMLIFLNLQLITGATTRDLTPAEQQAIVQQPPLDDPAEQYQREYDYIEPRLRYDPYVMWNRAPFDGVAITILPDGARATPGAICDADEAYRVHIYGGSAAWGAGVPDDATITAYLQQQLTAPDDRPLCVVNYGDLNLVSTQSMVKLMRHLQAGVRPDQVIFYGGSNDILAAYERGEAGVHRLYDRIEENFAVGQPPFLLRLVANSFTVAYLRTLIDLEPEEPPRLSGPVESTVAVYANNIRMVNALADQFGFTVTFFWQPILTQGEKPLDDSEARLTIPDDFLQGFYTDVYAGVAALADETPNLYDLSGVFDDVTEQRYIDYRHLNPAGNAQIARRMIEIIQTEQD